jgi:hypothetical protein
MKLTSFVTGGVLAVACCLVAGNARAGIAYDFPAGLPGNVDNTFSVGYVFTVNEPEGVNLNALGLFDDGGNGFPNATMDVAIYSVTINPDNSLVGGARVAQTTFSGTTGGNVGTLLSGTSTRVRPVSGVLAAGQSYIIVAGTRSTAGTDIEQFYSRAANEAGATQPGPGSTVGTSLSFGGNYTSTKTKDFSIAGTLPGTWTYVDTAWTPAYAAGNFDFTPVPEPVHFAMAGAGMLGLIYIGRGLWQRRKTA